VTRPTLRRPNRRQSTIGNSEHDFLDRASKSHERDTGSHSDAFPPGSEPKLIEGTGATSQGGSIECQRLYCSTCVSVDSRHCRHPLNEHKTLCVGLLMHRSHWSRKKPCRHREVLKSRNPLPIGFMTLLADIHRCGLFHSGQPSISGETIL